ncbi:4Fe-4S dicluster domain-containing protein [Carboxydochorda subterranea]|uniref:4Fe-4S dicluster domain-containing protein n=1 Tax=Carboxydichorda subterranea TaxID=3109565 RepID=A0ABZ1BW03_9FIRM|nr:4Fe-4S dicluster domain-containing protein [Limnochorda sp. L945t]WRP16851.1 4Fe-4S dicluster domain-containing protein [Limnochorda sp. L945t]
MRYGMVIDLARCIGCQSCTAFCKVKNGTPPGVFLSKVLVHEVGRYPNTQVVYQPMLCMHCEQAPCVQVCPTGASYKRPDGIVAVDADRCMGCRYCVAACPYGARSFVESLQPYYPGFEPTPYEKVAHANHQAGVVEKCNFCMDRIERGEEPACVQTCPAKARTFGDLDDPNSEVSKLIARRHGYQLLAELGTNPSVYYLPA